DARALGSGGGSKEAPAARTSRRNLDPDHPPRVRLGGQAALEPRAFRRQGTLGHSCLRRAGHPLRAPGPRPETSSGFHRTRSRTASSVAASLRASPPLRESASEIAEKDKVWQERPRRRSRESGNPRAARGGGKWTPV